MSTIEQDTLKYHRKTWQCVHLTELENFFEEYQAQYPDDPSSFSCFCGFWYYRWKGEQEEIERKERLAEQRLEIDGVLTRYADIC